MAIIWVKAGPGRRVRLLDGRIVKDDPAAPAVPVSAGDPFTLRRLRDGDLVEAPAPADPAAPAPAPAAPAPAAPAPAAPTPVPVPPPAAKPTGAP